jgi:hypothetical protein
MEVIEQLRSLCLTELDDSNNRRYRRMEYPLRDMFFSSRVQLQLTDEQFGLLRDYVLSEIKFCLESGDASRLQLPTLDRLLEAFSPEGRMESEVVDQPTSTIPKY